ncbi:protein shank-like [Sphaeramia orbicularis]|uniref:protein shank-like n=1 Tax=Sphaeramia orbicularis TaxID=375764 RepID=UPI00117E13DD|nr:protein shank-like [Sphaeramia orbicularis]
MLMKVNVPCLKLLFLHYLLFLQRLSAREFSRRTIKERVGLLSTMFPGSSKPPSPLPPPAPLSPFSEMQMEFSASSLSSSPPPPPVSKTSSMYPVVHPVPDPTAQAGFSSVSLYTPALKDQIHKDSATPPSCTDTKTVDVFSSGDSSTCNNKTLSRRQTCSPLPDINREHELSSSSSEHKETFDGRHDRPQEYPHNEHKLPTTADETVDEKKLAENDHVKCHGNPRGAAHKSIIRSDSCPAAAASYMKERTVGKVSSAIDAKAQVLAILYETDHRPNAAPVRSMRRRRRQIKKPNPVFMACVQRCN